MYDPAKLYKHRSFLVEILVPAGCGRVCKRCKHETVEILAKESHGTPRLVHT